MPRTLIVVPCFNEAQRLPTRTFLDFAERADEVDFLFVNDGSTDATLATLETLASRRPERFSVLDQQPNRGKAEAVRVGMREACRRAPAYAGYWDADLATPLEEIPRFVEIFEARPACEMVFGARVQLLGRTIERSSVRHYAGRVFATAASRVLDLPVYDTQCGAKLFRCAPHVCALFEEPFCSRWIFDVEIIARRRTGRAGGGDVRNAIYELPLRQWRDVAGSKVAPKDFLRALLDLYRIRRRYFGAARAPAG